MLNLLVGGQAYSTVEGSVDEGLIMAYVDGELDQAGRTYVEGLLSTNPKAREIADLIRSSYSLIKSAFQDEPKAPASTLSVVPSGAPCAPRRPSSAPRTAPLANTQAQGQA